MKILLTKIKNRHYDENGRLYAWTVVDNIAEFNGEDEALDYIDKNILLLPDEAAFFTGSASTLMRLQEYLRVARECQHEVAS